MRWLLLATFSLVGALSAQPDHFHTDRPEARLLPLPSTEDAFGFVIFGDRTGGPAEGIRVLEQAVVDTNLLDPDLVMTVGDLIQGYNRTEPWMEQMREFRGVMDGLAMPWFPVAGNHDVYWRGDGKPPEEHELHYEEHFGPLWYAFEHKRCWFVVLYTDEGNPETGERDFGKPASQRMSPAQKDWLRKTLAKASGAEHVFVFLHHPRWLGGGYGDDWENVHRILVDAGNVSAVFAGHIHRMRYEGVRDGIEYFALATTGGHLSREIAGAGFLHHFNVVTVRDDKISIAAIPVGGVLDPRAITGQVSDDVAKLSSELRARQEEPIRLAADGSVEAIVTLQVHNPIASPIALTVTPQCRDNRWWFEPDHVHPELAGGETRELKFRVMRAPLAVDEFFALPEWRVGCDYLGETLRVTIPERTDTFVLGSPEFAIANASHQAQPHALRLGSKECAVLASEDLDLPDGAFTSEAWFRADRLDGRTALLAKTEGSEFGIFVSDGVPDFSVHLDGAYVTARAPEAVLKAGVWHHIAGVFDGVELRLYVDGALVASTPGSGVRTRNDLPFFIGADPNGLGQPMSFFRGQVDEVRLTAAAVYSGESFEPPRQLAVTEETRLWLQMERRLGPWLLDSSGRDAHPQIHGNAVLVIVEG